MSHPMAIYSLLNQLSVTGQKELFGDFGNTELFRYIRTNLVEPLPITVQQVHFGFPPGILTPTSILDVHPGKYDKYMLYLRQLDDDVLKYMGVSQNLLNARKEL